MDARGGIGWEGLAGEEEDDDVGEGWGQGEGEGELGWGDGLVVGEAGAGGEDDGEHDACFGGWSRAAARRG